MAQTQSLRAVPPADRVHPCGPGRGKGWGWWPLIPLAILGGALTVGLLAWPLGAPGWSRGPGPDLWALFPFGIFFTAILVFFLIRWAFWGYGWHGRWAWPGYETAEEVLRGRFARGEIDADRFREMLNVLEDATRPGDSALPR